MSKPLSASGIYSTSYLPSGFFTVTSRLARSIDSTVTVRVFCSPVIVLVTCAPAGTASAENTTAAPNVVNLLIAPPSQVSSLKSEVSRKDSSVQGSSACNEHVSCRVQEQESPVIAGLFGPPLTGVSVRWADARPWDRVGSEISWASERRAATS